MAVVYPHAMQAEHPHQRAHHHIRPQIDMEVEAGGIQVNFALRHQYHDRGENKRKHVAEHQKSIDEEAPIRDAQYPPPGGLLQIRSHTAGLGHLPSLSHAHTHKGAIDFRIAFKLYNTPGAVIYPRYMEAKCTLANPYGGLCDS